jgi:hypothetical protein
MSLAGVEDERTRLCFDCHFARVRAIMLLGLLGTNKVVFVLDLVLMDLCGMFIFAFWVVTVADVTFFFQALTATAVAVVAIFMIRDSLRRGAVEDDNSQGWLFEGLTDRHHIMMYIFGEGCLC